MFWTIPLVLEFSQGIPRKQTLERIERDYVPAINHALDQGAVYRWCRQEIGWDDLDCRVYLKWQDAKR